MRVDCTKEKTEIIKKKKILARLTAATSPVVIRDTRRTIVVAVKSRFYDSLNATCAHKKEKKLNKRKRGPKRRDEK